MKCPQIAFVCDTNLPNYLDQPAAYNYLEGKHSATGYYYWILKNAGVPNLHLVSLDAKLSDYDIVVLYYENQQILPAHRPFKTIQVVSDRPQIENCDLYIACNYAALHPIIRAEYVKMVGVGLKRVLKGRWHYIHYPMALNYKKCQPQWPPCIYHFSGRQQTLLPSILQPKFIDHLKQQQIHLRFDFINDHNTGDEDVYFCIRDSLQYFSGICQGNNVDTPLGQKTANRLYQSWKMGTPAIFDPSQAMLAIRKSEYDFLIATNQAEFEYQCMRLKTDSLLFKTMVDNCQQRQNEHTNEQIVSQWLEAFQIV